MSGWRVFGRDPFDSLDGTGSLNGRPWVNGRPVEEVPPPVAEPEPIAEPAAVPAPQPVREIGPGESRIVDFSREVLRFEPSVKQAELLDAIYRERIRTAVLRIGRRGGKGRMASIIAAFEATANADAHLAAVPAGEQVAIVVIGTSQRQARIVHKYIAGFLQAPELAPLVVKDGEDEIVLSNGIVVLTLPCHAASVRGYAAAIVIFDEMAWYQGRDGSPLDPKELWDGLVPATAQFPAGKVLVLSTPRWAAGFFPDLCARARSGQFADWREWHASTAEMNPRISDSFLEQEQTADPASYRREYLALFDSGIGAVFSAETVRDAVSHGLVEVPPVAGLRGYLITVDAAFVGDRFVGMVGHAEAERVLVDVIRGWRGSRGQPVQLEPTLDEIAALSVAYGKAPVVIDQYSAEPIRQALARKGVRVIERPWTNESKVDAVGGHPARPPDADAQPARSPGAYHRTAHP